jgi:IPT/TIG domain
MATGATALVVLGVLPNAATGNFMITAQGMSGSLSHSVTLALAVQAFVGPPLPRTTYVRTDAVLASDDPPGEARHRRIAYDAANKHLFVANRAMNRIEVFSTPDQARVTQINIPAACSADMSADGGTVWVGTTTEQAVAIDTATLHVRSRYSIQPLTPLPNSVFEIRSAGLTLAATPARPELEQIPARVLVPGLALHPTGALLYQPFLTGPAPAAPPAIGIQGGVDILDAHTGRLRLRIFLPEPLAALSTDIDALHGSFLAIDETGQRIFALTTSGVAIIQLATVPLSIGTISPNSASSSGGTTLTIRGSGFQSGATVTIGGTPAATTFVDINTLSVITPTLPTGPLQVVIITADGDSYSLDAALTSN